MGAIIPEAGLCRCSLDNDGNDNLLKARNVPDVGQITMTLKMYTQANDGVYDLWSKTLRLSNEHRSQERFSCGLSYRKFHLPRQRLLTFPLPVTTHRLPRRESPLPLIAFSAKYTTP